MEIRGSEIALKEWACVVEALASGIQKLLIRKGGIADAGGEFRMEADAFFLYPTFEHQKKEMIRPEFHPLFDETIARRSELVEITARARVERIEKLASIAPLLARRGEFIWSDAYLEMRARYKPEKPLYVVTLSCERLETPIRFRETADQAGCVSWVKV